MLAEGRGDVALGGGEVSGVAGIRWPGDGTYVIEAADARPFTVHEFMVNRLSELEESIANCRRSLGAALDWMTKERSAAAALVDAPDRPITADDLNWAATARCRCGAGYAYPEWLHDTHGHWFCSASLLGTAPVGSEHDCAKPFAFWSIKSAKQPSANGQTTRPA